MGFDHLISKVLPKTISVFYGVFRYDSLMKPVLNLKINPLMPGGNKKVTHT